MRLQRIYSSKLYVTSTRKDKIHAAMEDPINVELVQQLEEYLNDDSLRELKQAKAEVKREQAAETDAQAGGSAPADSVRPSVPSSGGGASHSSFTGSPMADFGEDGLADIDIPDDMSGGEEAPAPEAPAPEEVVESVTQEGKKITATSEVWTSVEDVACECATIKGTLNAREDTTGVSRLEVKENELWVYYNDDSNLNDKMVEVISALNASGYTYLKFNRLARSNNAIVFDINLNTSEPIKSIKEIEEEK